MHPSLCFNSKELNLVSLIPRPLFCAPICIFLNPKHQVDSLFIYIYAK